MQTSKHPAARRLARLARVSAAALVLLPWHVAAAGAARPDRLDERAVQALHRAATYFRERVAVHGSYLWRYSTDLSYRRGEGLATPSQGWVQPPGTPAVGMAYLQAYAATGERYYLDGAIESAHALASTQLESGGWYYAIEFDPEARRAWCYRLTADGCLDRDNRFRNSSTLDDNTSQSALRLLMLVDGVLGGTDSMIHDAVVYGLNQFIEAQYPNGAWPVRSDRRVPREQAPAVGPARYPDTWPREFVQPGRLAYGTNDDSVRDMIRTFLLAHRLYGREEYREAAVRAGDFLLEAQMPAPQSGWAQTYNGAMEPIWGRKFEPPAIAGRETVGCIKAMLDLYLYTGNRRYLDAAAAALDWLEASRLPEGDWARFYELRTNQPLYMTRDYRLTYADDDLPTHYSFRGDYGVAEVQQAYRAIARQGRAAYLAGLDRRSRDPASPTAADRETVAAIIDGLDPEGRWLEDGMIRSRTLIRNFRVLTRFLVARSSDHGTPAQAIAAAADPLGAGLHAEVFRIARP